MAYIKWRYVRFTVVEKEAVSLAGRVDNVRYYESGLTYPPNMSNNTTPSPYGASASVNNTTAYLAFDSSGTTYWSTNTGQFPNNYVQIDFGSDSSGWRAVDRVVAAFESGAGRKPIEITVTASTDGSAYTTLLSYRGADYFSSLDQNLLLISGDNSVYVNSIMMGL